MPLPADPFLRMGATLVSALANATAAIGAVAGVRATLRRRPSTAALGGVPAYSSGPTLTCRTADLAGAEVGMDTVIQVTADADGAATTWACAGSEADADTGITRIALTEPV